jgi:hypothetical protein
MIVLFMSDWGTWISTAPTCANEMALLYVDDTGSTGSASRASDNTFNYASGTTSCSWWMTTISDPDLRRIAGAYHHLRQYDFRAGRRLPDGLFANQTKAGLHVHNEGRNRHAWLMSTARGAR